MKDINGKTINIHDRVRHTGTGEYYRMVCDWPIGQIELGEGLMLVPESDLASRGWMLTPDRARKVEVVE